MFKYWYIQLVAIVAIATQPVHAQGNRPVLWSFYADPSGHDELILRAEAHLAPGWHIYSQHIDEGGPMPTTIRFADNNDFISLGATVENGLPETYCDETFGVNVTSYSGTVTFLQKIKLLRPKKSIQGTVEYMSCDTDVCIPDRINFRIPVPSGN